MNVEAGRKSVQSKRDKKSYKEINIRLTDGDKNLMLLTTPKKIY